MKDKASAAGDITLRTVAKLMNNSTYGRLASNFILNTSTVILDTDETTLIELFKVHRITKVQGTNKSIANHNVIPDKLPKKDISMKNMLAYNQACKKAASQLNNNDINIAVAAFVTARGRIQLHEAMM
jgi:hypothetical protein